MLLTAAAAASTLPVPASKSHSSNPFKTSQSIDVVLTAAPAALALPVPASVVTQQHTPIASAAVPAASHACRKSTPLKTV
jgi:hypothetical protein